MSVFICDKDTLAVLDKFLAGFYVSSKVNFQNDFASLLYYFTSIYIYNIVCRNLSFNSPNSFAWWHTINLTHNKLVKRKVKIFIFTSIFHQLIMH